MVRADAGADEADLDALAHRACLLGPCHGVPRPASHGAFRRFAASQGASWAVIAAKAKPSVAGMALFFRLDSALEGAGCNTPDDQPLEAEKDDEDRDDRRRRHGEELAEAGFAGRIDEGAERQGHGVVA